jgi:hypothetical protein
MQATPKQNRARFERELARVKNGLERLAVDVRDTTMTLVETGRRWATQAVDELSQALHRSEHAGRPTR